MNIKDCPFCGGESTVTRISIKSYLIGCDKVRCYVKPMLNLYDENIPEEKGIELWNKRRNKT